jgi:hypothetical protein
VLIVAATFALKKVDPLLIVDMIRRQKKQKSLLPTPWLFHLYKTKMIDKELWLRWQATCKSMMTIPKFKKVWDKTKDSRSHEFRELVD